MTSIAIFRFRHPVDGEEQIWAVGDTRITAMTTSSSMPVESISSGAKIFSLPLRVSKNPACHEGGTVMLETSIGMAYAGNTTLGLNLHAQLSQILPHLVCDSFATPPVISLEQIAEFAGNMLKQMAKEMNWRYSSQNEIQTAEVAFFGKCPDTGKFSVYSLRPTVEMNELVCRPVDVTPQNAISAHLKSEVGAVLLGAHKKEITDLIFARVSDVLGPGVEFNDLEVQAQASIAPKYVLEALIHHDVFPTIGRGLQIMIATQESVYPATWGRPQSETVPPEDYEMYSLFNFNVLDALRNLGKTNIHNWPSLSPDFDVDAKGISLITEFQETLRRLKGEPPVVLIFR